MGETLTPQDIALYTKAQQAFQHAQAQFQFVQSHLGETYKMGQFDTFNLQTGEITRGKMEGPVDPTQEPELDLPSAPEQTN